MIHLDLNVRKYIARLCKYTKDLIKILCFVYFKVVLSSSIKKEKKTFILFFNHELGKDYLLNTYYVPDRIPFIRSSQPERREEINSYYKVEGDGFISAL